MIHVLFSSENGQNNKKARVSLAGETGSSSLIAFNWVINETDPVSSKTSSRSPDKREEMHLSLSVHEKTFLL